MRLTTALVLFSTASLCESGQAGVPSEFSVHTPTVLYHFVRSVAALNREAQARDLIDNTGMYLRDALSNTIGLNGSDTASLFKLAEILEGQFASLDLQASQIIAVAQSQRTLSGTLAPPPPQLGALQIEKRKLIGAIAGVLDNSDITSEGRVALHKHLNRTSRANGA